MPFFPCPTAAVIRSNYWCLFSNPGPIAYKAIFLAQNIHFRFLLLFFRQTTSSRREFSQTHGVLVFLTRIFLLRFVKRKARIQFRFLDYQYFDKTKIPVQDTSVDVGTTSTWLFKRGAFFYTLSEAKPLKVPRNGIEKTLQNPKPFGPITAAHSPVRGRFVRCCAWNNGHQMTPCRMAFRMGGANEYENFT